MDADETALVQDHIYLADQVAASFVGPTCDFSEARSLALFGLTMAAARWKPYCAEHGFDTARVEYFKPFALRRMRGSILDEYRSADHATRAARQRHRQIVEASEDNPSEAVLAERTGMTVTEIRKVRREVSQLPMSLDGTPTELPEVVSSVEDQVALKHLLTGFQEFIGSLEPVEQQIVALHYYDGRELMDIAAEVGLSASKTSQIHTDVVLRVLKHFQEVSL